MKVVCIDATDLSRFPHLMALCGSIVEGETYTVLRTIDGEDGVPFHVLAEKPVVAVHRDRVAESGWRAHRFVPLEYWQSEFSEAGEKQEPKEAR